ncbi:MAG: hypothetical protein OZ924_18080 [Burkholderiaceae bacterium]|nr:hypothetical protein [Burkholderiaceae bacterium]
MIRNLLDELFEIHYVKPDYRFKKWAKRITRVDTSQANGYAFAGDFIREGTVEVQPGPALYLVSITTGTAKYNSAKYLVVRQDADGTLHATDIKDDDAERGWALRIRDRVAALLAEISDTPAKPTADEAMQQLAAMLAGLPAEQAAQVPAEMRSLIEAFTS